MNGTQIRAEIQNILESDLDLNEMVWQIYDLSLKAAKPTEVTSETYQLFQREYEKGLAPTQLVEATPFSRATVFRLKKDYDKRGDIYLKYGAHHDVNESWQRQVPCPDHPYKEFGETTQLLQYDDDTNRVSCNECDWYQDFPRYPAIKENESDK